MSSPTLDWFHILVSDQMSPFNRMVTQLKVEFPSAGLVPHPGPEPDVSILLREWLSMLLRKNQHLVPFVDPMRVSVSFVVVSIRGALLTLSNPSLKSLEALEQWQKP